jgi:hypothetical protein
MKKYIKAWLVAVFIFTTTLFPSLAEARSTYVLPYPGSMPGNKLYKISQIQENLQKYWYFGSFASFDYDRKYSDKYLVEAKILFEYEQYLLGYNALLISDRYFSRLPNTLKKAVDEKKDISEKKTILLSEAEKHKEVLRTLLNTTPETVNWVPENEVPRVIPLHVVIRRSIDIRESR